MTHTAMPHTALASLSTLTLCAALANAVLAIARLEAGDNPRVERLIQYIASDDANVRYRARAEAARVGAEAIPALGQLLEDKRLEVARTASAAIERIVHHAGRPGAASERPPVTRALGALLSPQLKITTRIEILHRIAFVGGDDAVLIVAPYLDDSERNVREQARLSLERIPGEAAVRALIKATETAREDERADLVFSLGKKRSRSSIPFLLKTAKGATGDLQVAALGSLARLAEPKAAALFREILASDDLPERVVIFREYLRLADALLARGAVADATAIYQETLRGASADFQRERALHQLSPEGSGGALDALLAGLADSSERVRNLAVRRLKQLEGADIDQTLRLKFRDAPAAAKPVLLEAVVRRDPDGTKGILEESAASSDPDLQVMALHLLGRLSEKRHGQLRLQVARSGSSAVRSLAVAGELAASRRLLENGESERAMSAYLRALELAQTAPQKEEAISGLEQIANPEALRALMPLLEDKNVATRAAAAFMTLASKVGASGDRDAAERHFLRIIRGNFPRDVKARAAEELRKIDRDPLRVPRSQGFIVDWWCIGPIEDGDGQGLARVYFPEETIDLVNIQRIGPRRFRWQRLRDLSLEGSSI